MFSANTLHTRSIVLLLIILLAIPCTVKNEVKQWLQIEANAQTQALNQKQTCTSYCDQRNSQQKNNLSKQYHPIPGAIHATSIVVASQQVKIPDHFNFHKEKIPSYKLFRRFLI